MCASQRPQVSFDVIPVPVDVSSHAEVSDFGHASRSFARQQAIPGGDVPERPEAETGGEGALSRGKIKPNFDLKVSTDVPLVESEESGVGQNNRF